MTKNVKRVVTSVVLGALAIAMVAGLGFAFVGQSATANAAPLAVAAQTSTTTPSTTKPAKSTTGTKVKKVRFHVSKTVLTAAANALGINEATLKTDLKNGQSIAAIAKAQNKDLPTVETAIVNTLKTQLDTALKNGKITQARHDKAVANLQTRVDKLVNHTFKAHSKKSSTSTTTKTPTTSSK